MIVNLNYFKRQKKDSPVDSKIIKEFMYKKPHEIVCFLMITQLWLKSVSMTILFNGHLLHLHVEKIDQYIQSHTIKFLLDMDNELMGLKTLDYGDGFYNLFMVLQTFDGMLSMFGSYYIRNDAMCCNVSGIKLWTMSNNIYTFLWTVWIIFATVQAGSDAFFAKTLIVCLFGIYNFYVLYQMSHYYEKSSYLFLEQDPAAVLYANNSLKPSNEEDSKSVLLQSNNVSVKIGTEAEE